MPAKSQKPKETKDETTVPATKVDQETTTVDKDSKAAMVKTKKPSVTFRIVNH